MARLIVLNWLHVFPHSSQMKGSIDKSRKLDLPASGVCKNCNQLVLISYLFLIAI